MVQQHKRVVEFRLIQPIDSRHIKHWDEINNLTKMCRLSADVRMDAGDASHKIVHVQPNGELDINKSHEVSFLPYVHNVDSFGYNTNVVKMMCPMKQKAGLGY